MKVLLSWLKDFVDIGESADAVAEALTEQGLEVESITSTAGLFDRVVVGEILSCEPLAGDPHLLGCEVTVGGETCRTVCGDPKVRVGQRAPVALPGALLASGAAVEVCQVAGERSEAVLCSLYDLGLRSVQDEVVSLDGKPAPGSPVAPLLGLDDTLLEIELTPNRGDCLSVLGLAREVAARSGRAVHLPEIHLDEAPDVASDRVRIDIETPDLCPQYVGRMVEGIRVGPSPLWLTRRLRLMGVRPINNVVDVANYVMFELGQPLHTFDFPLLAGGRILVRLGRPGERMVALDGNTLDVGPDTLVIADGAKVVAVAGVIGGENSGVTDGTRSVLIESAHFDPVAVRKGARRMGVSTEASVRFERGIDPAGVGRAADRTARLLCDLAGGRVLSGRVVAGSGAPPRTVIPLRADRTNAHLGLSLSAKEMAELLHPLGFDVTLDPDLGATPPTYRNDVTMEADLVEEVARMYGYSRIPEETARHRVAPAPPTHWSAVVQRTRAILCGRGLHEVVTPTLGTAEDFSALGRASAEEVERLRLRNPFSLDQSVLRPSLVPGILSCVRLNLNRRREAIRFFEIGTAFRAAPAGGRPEESRRLAGALTGLRGFPSWSESPDRVDFYDLRGLVEDSFEALRLAPPRFEAGEVPTLDPRFSVHVLLGTEQVGVAGRIDATRAGAFDLREPVFVFELLLDKIADMALELQQFRSLPRFPAVTRDLAVVVDENVGYAEVTATILEAGRPLLAGHRLFDLYRGAQVPDGKKSLAFGLTFRLEDRTLRDEEVDGTLASIVDALRDRHGASLRSDV